MVVSPDELVQREYYYAIVDEVDSVLVDEARTPLIISGPVASDDQKFSEMKPTVDRIVNAQRNFVTKIVAEAEQHLAAGEERGGRASSSSGRTGASRSTSASPRSSRSRGTRGSCSRPRSNTSGTNRRRMHEIDDELYYAIDEKDHSINLTEKGRDLLARVGRRQGFLHPARHRHGNRDDRRRRDAPGRGDASRGRTRSTSATPNGATGSTPSSSSSGPTRSTRRTTSTW